MSTPADITKVAKLYFAEPSAFVIKEGWNTRFDMGDIHGLELSIKANGFRRSKPIVAVRNDARQLEVVDGARRMTAVWNLIKKGHEFPEGIPVSIEDKGSSVAERTLLMFTANDGKPFLPLEAAAALQRLRDEGMTVKQIMAATGKSDVYITDTLALLTAAPEVKEAVTSGKVGKTLASKIAIKAKGDHARQKELVETAAKGGKAGKKLANESADKIKRRAPPKKAQETLVAPKPLTQSQLETRESMMTNLVSKGLKELGVDEVNIRGVLAQTSEGATGFHFGVLIGIRAALGKDPKLSL
mgnify:CR=1 FL=1